MAISTQVHPASPLGPVYINIPATDSRVVNNIKNKRFNEINFDLLIPNISATTDYVFVMKFSAKNNDRGQFSVNGTRIFDSETHGSGGARITTVWGKVPASVNPTGLAKFTLKGSGSTWVGEDATIELARVRG